MTTHQDVESLLARVAMGDRSAFKSLYLQVAGVMLATAARVLRDRSAAEDVVQEVFTSLWHQASEPGTSPARTLAWLCVVTRNRALDHLRRCPKEISMHGETSDGEEFVHDAVSESPGIFEQLSFEQEHQRLQHCLRQLDAEPREAVLLAYMEGLTHSELAQRMRRPLGTIKAWTRRSLMALKLCMGPAA
jgi:RNA polymerase sigma-70 factor (ECF subfamily)